MAAYYNEIDPFAAGWLRELIAAGLIAPGEVDERSIEDVTADDLKGFTQCHFFAGIGVWSYALRSAGWPDDRMVWTGSCPCQPYSAAGKRGGFADERHLWPAFFHLIDKRHPSVVLGEQVASKDGLAWLDLVSSDMEGAGYAFGAVDTCAAGFGQAHLRQRLYFVGLADDDARLERWSRVPERADQCTIGPGGMASRMAKSNDTKRRADYTGEHKPDRPNTGWTQGSGDAQGCSDAGRMGVTQNQQHDGCGDEGRRGRQSSNAGDTGGVEHTDSASQHERPSGGKQPLCVERDRPDEDASIYDPGEIDPRWAHVDWLLCRNPAGEPSWRPVEPGTFPLAHGVTARMGKLRAYGNSLDSKTAASFVEAVMDALGRP